MDRGDGREKPSPPVVCGALASLSFRETLAQDVDLVMFVLREESDAPPLKYARRHGELQHI